MADVSLPISMAERDLTTRLTAFTDELRTVVAGLDPELGWYAAFARRHRVELDAWLSGRELPPWDALADLLQDYAVQHGFAAAERTGWRIRERYEAAARARDALPDGRDALLRRLAVAGEAEAESHSRERMLAAAEQNARHAGQTQEAERLGALRLWAKDDEERSQARQAELRARIAAIPPRGARTQEAPSADGASARPGGWPPAADADAGRGPAAYAEQPGYSDAVDPRGKSQTAPGDRGVGGGDAAWRTGGSPPRQTPGAPAARGGPAAHAEPAAPQAQSAPAAQGGRARPAPGAAVAGDPAAPCPPRAHAPRADGGPSAYTNPAAPQGQPTPTAPGGRAEPAPDTTARPAGGKRGKGGRRARGARFAGLDDEAAPGAEAQAMPQAAGSPPPSGSRFAGAMRESRESRSQRRVRAGEEDRGAAAETVERLRKLRAEEQSGAAHMVLSEAAAGPAERLPSLLAELERTGMVSDLATLLWEAASLPPDGLAAVAEALAAAGRDRDCGQLLRQGAARPASEAGAVAAALWSAGRADEAVTLLAALVEARSAEEAARAARAAPEVVAPLLLDAALRVSPRHHYAVGSEIRRASQA
jgi:hypothetical protein